MTGTALRRLDRERDGRPAAPIRIAHLGPGNFFRAHQAWYTEHAPDAAEWGIAAFAGRRGVVARDLAAQDGLYTLLVRAADGDHPEVVSAVAAVSAELDDWRRCFARPELSVVTTTVTCRSARKVMRCQNSRRANGSTPLVGSSRKRISGSCSRAVAMARRCLYPPGNWPLARCINELSSKACSAQAMRSRLRAPRNP